VYPPTNEFGPAAPDAVWDEYQWEAFLRRQDACAAEYMALVDYYGEDPDAHNLIYRAMGWHHLLTRCKAAPDPQACRRCVRKQRETCSFHAFRRAHTAVRPRKRVYDGNDPADLHDPAIEQALAEVQWKLRYAEHPVRARAVALANRLCDLGQMHEQITEPGAEPFSRLLHYAGRCAGKINAALGGYLPPRERGVVIAHLKIAFGAASSALGWLEVCASAGRLPADAAQALVQMLLDIRDDLVVLIVELRYKLMEVKHQLGGERCD
jgi:hypothetical protein